MKLLIDNREIEARVDASLYDTVKEMGLVTGKLSCDPIVAKIAGRVFTLNYVPKRSKDTGVERSSIRRAMAASGGAVRLLRYKDPEGREAYTRTAQFVMFLALKRVYPTARAKMSCTVNSGLFVKVSGAPDFSAERLKSEILSIVGENLTLTRRRISTRDAIEYYKSIGEEDKAELLSYRTEDHFDIYENGEFADYYYGEMAPSTGYLRSFDVIAYDEGFIFIFPDRNNPDRVSNYREMPNFHSV
jgi:threonyl-tRNA synthetase